MRKTEALVNNLPGNTHGVIRGFPLLEKDGTTRIKDFGISTERRLAISMLRFSLMF
jgi:hypothetical protein